MRGGAPYILKGEVHVLEFKHVFENINEKTGKLQKSKRWIFVALEIAKNGSGRAYAEAIKYLTVDSLTYFLDKHISIETFVVMEKLKAYTLSNKYKNLRQLPVNDDKNFPELQAHIANLKAWLRKNYRCHNSAQLQGYLDEYHFRFNRRKKKGSIFDALICRMVKSEKPKRLNNKRKTSTT